MKTKITTLLWTLFTLGIALAPLSAHASGFYANPRVGWMVALDESDVDTSLGIGVGYRWEKLISLEFDYTRVFAGVDDNNLLELDLTVTGHRDFFWPYFLVGGGIAISTAPNPDPEPLMRIGGGTMLMFEANNVWEFVRPYVQLSYVNIDLDNHFLEPQIGLMFGF